MRRPQVNPSLSRKRRFFNPSLEQLEDRSVPAVVHMGLTGETYNSLSQVTAAAHDGDTILIDAGTYTSQEAVFTQNNLTIEGVGGPVIFNDSGYQLVNQKGIFDIRGNNASVMNITFENAHDLSGSDGDNFAGIRGEGITLTIENCSFFHNDDGILINNDSANFTTDNNDLTVTGSEFGFNGYGDGFSHNMYVGEITSFTLEGCYTHDANQGHLIKSRALTNIIEGNDIEDGTSGGDSSAIDLPFGGVSYVIGNVVVRSASAANHNIITYDDETGTAPYVQDLYVVNNTFVNNVGVGTFVNVSNTPSIVDVTDNIFAGGGTVLSSPIGTPTNNLIGNSPGFVNAAGDDYHLAVGSAAIGAATNPGVSSLGFSLVPAVEYTSPNTDTPRFNDADQGAYAFQNTLFQSSFGGATSSLPNPPWDTVLGAGFSVNGSNQAVSSAIVNGLFKAATVENVSVANVSVQADVALNPSPANGTSAVAVIARSQDANDVNNCYFAALTPAPAGLDQLLIEKTVNGQIFGMAAKALPAGTTSGTLRLDLFGNTLTAYLNGQLECTVTDSTYSTAGNIGIGAQDQGAIVANFSAAGLQTPAGVFKDDFNRTASNSLGNPWAANAVLPAPNSTSPGGGFGINGTDLAIPLTTGLNVASLYGLNFTTSVNVVATIVNAGGGAGVVADWNSATQSGYELLLSGSSLQLFTVSHGVATPLGTAHSTGAASGTVSLEVAAGSLNVYFNGSLLFALSNTAFTSGSAGLAANGTGATFSHIIVSGS